MEKKGRGGGVKSANGERKSFYDSSAHIHTAKLKLPTWIYIWMHVLYIIRTYRRCACCVSIYQHLLGSKAVHSYTIRRRERDIYTRFIHNDPMGKWQRRCVSVSSRIYNTGAAVYQWKEKPKKSTVCVCVLSASCLYDVKENVDPWEKF